MNATDAALIEAWKLFLKNSNTEVDEKLETLLPILIDAGYVKTDTHTWRFTPTGAARAEALTKNRGD